jgi:tetratricopeptide (TPR) repeat protein
MGKIDYNDTNHKSATYWEHKGEAAARGHNYWDAAKDFKKAAEALDRAGDHENAAHDYERTASQLDTKGDLKGAALYLEKAGADRTNDPSVKDQFRQNIHTEMDYSEAGEDRMNAGKAAGENHKEAAKQYGQAEADFNKAADALARASPSSDDIKKYNTQAALAGEKAAAEAGEDHMDAGKAAGRNHKEAAKQYGLAKENFTKAADAATRSGNIDDAKKYSAKADDAGTKAANEEKLVKPEGGLPAHKNPKNWH